MLKLTPRQEEVLDVVRAHIEDTGMPPTRADIARQLGFRSANAAEEHLKALARKGALDIIPGASRGIRLRDSRAASASGGRQQTSSMATHASTAIPSPDWAETEGGIPIVGRVAAGEPILAAAHVEDHCAIDPAMFKPRADFMLRVRGDSMINVGIYDGDLLAVHSTPVANDGAIVVARIDDEVTVKRLKRGRSKSRLQLLPENDSLSPIDVDLKTQDFAIEGLSVGVVRALT